MTRIKVCGTIVYSSKNNILVVQGRKTNKWSFPKGHRYECEGEFECAIRETEEETGLILDSNYERIENLPTGVYYVYRLQDEPALEPHDLKEVMDARWVAPDELRYYYNNYDLRAFFCEKRAMREQKKQVRLQYLKETNYSMLMDTVIYF
jgi:8-oxo-dGTP pyrophosphatase MutT (NUDIX family)